MSWLMLKGETMLKNEYVDTEIIESVEPLDDDEDDDLEDEEEDEEYEVEKVD